MEFFSNSEQETINIAYNFGKTLSGGDVILLDGDLGAGKTHFTKGIAKALGIKAIVTSPTFTIMNTYSGENLNLFHFDMYRIENEDELKELGFEEVIGNGKGVCCFEWYKNTPHLFDNIPYILVTIEKIDDEKRKIIIKGK